MIIWVLFSLPHLLSASYVFKVIPKRAYEKVQKETPFDAIIVPGVPYEDQSMSRIMEGRVKWAVHLYRIGWTKNIVFSGGAVYTPYYEAKIMSLYAQAYGVPKEHIYTDTVAEHSTENVYYGWKMARKYNMNKLALATDPYQSMSLQRFINDRYLEISAVPMVFKMLDTMKFEPVTIDPSSAVAPANFKPLPERESFLKRLAGTLGIWIKENVYD